MTQPSAWSRRFILITPGTRSIFDPWRQETWDLHDTVLIADPKADGNVGEFYSAACQTKNYLPTWYALRTEPAHASTFAAQYPDTTMRANETQAAGKTQVHAGTPSVAHADSLGRTFLTVAHNRFERNARDYRREVFNPCHLRRSKATSAKCRRPRSYYNALRLRRARLLVSHSGQHGGGERWLLGDVAGKPIRAWDSRGHAFIRNQSYDALARPTGKFVIGSRPALQSPTSGSWAMKSCSRNLSMARTWRATRAPIGAPASGNCMTQQGWSPAMRMTLRAIC